MSILMLSSKINPLCQINVFCCLKKLQTLQHCKISNLGHDNQNEQTWLWSCSTSKVMEDHISGCDLSEAVLRMRIEGVWQLPAEEDWDNWCQPHMSQLSFRAILHSATSPQADCGCHSSEAECFLINFTTNVCVCRAVCFIEQSISLCSVLS